MSTELGERFWSKVDRAGDCWLWRGATGSNGYGRFLLGGKLRQAHRLALEARLGSHLGANEQACHHCDTPACVRPEHLFVGTAKENAEDRQRKGRLGKLNPVAIQVIRYFAKKGGRGWQARVARVYGINVSTVRRIANREMWPQVA